MPLPFASRANNAEAIHDEDNKPADGVSGWAGIERHLMKHDTAEMRDYTEDIDTLLVFDCFPQSSPHLLYKPTQC